MGKLLGFIKGIVVAFLILIAIMVFSGNAKGAAHLTKSVGHGLSVAAHGISNFASDF